MRVRFGGFSRGAKASGGIGSGPSIVAAIAGVGPAGGGGEGGRGGPREGVRRGEGQGGWQREGHGEGEGPPSGPHGPHRARLRPSSIGATPRTRTAPPPPPETTWHGALAGNLSVCPPTPGTVIVWLFPIPGPISSPQSVGRLGGPLFGGVSHLAPPDDHPYRRVSLPLRMRSIGADHPEGKKGHSATFIYRPFSNQNIAKPAPHFIYPQRSG